MYPTFYEWKKDVSKMFAKYGFIANPLDFTALKTLWLIDADMDEIYRVGCDLHAGYTLNEALGVGK